MRILIVGVALAVLALAACSGHDGTTTEGPSVGALPQPVATEVESTTSGGEGSDDVDLPAQAVLPTVAATDDAAAANTASSEETTTPAAIEATPPVATPPPETGEDGPSEGVADEPAPLTVPWADFPDNVALLSMFYPDIGTHGDFPPNDVVRIYRDRDGDLVREVLFAYGARHFWQQCGDYEDAFSVDYGGIQTLAGQLPECGGYYFWLAGRPDASSLVMTVCVEPHCDGLVSSDDPRGRTAIYESRDGGVTWEKLAIFDLPWYATQVLPGDGNGNTRLVLELWSYHLVDAEQASDCCDRILGGTEQEGRTTYMLWPSREEFSRVAALEAVLEEDYDDGSYGYPLSWGDGRLLLPWYGPQYQPEELIGPQGAAMGWATGDFPRNWPTIRDPETGEQWPVRLPYDVLSLDDLLWHIAIQHGPFLRVLEVEGGCLPIRAESSQEAEELACMAERALLQDQDGDVITDEDVTWHRVRTPAGIQGWADGRYLE